MAESIVQDWLIDFQRIQNQPDETKAFAIEHDSDSDIAEAIFTILSECQKHEVLVYNICQQLLQFYRSSEKPLQTFPLQFIPVLIYTYLHGVANGNKKGVRCVETLLICIYNGEVSTEEGFEKILQFRMPILAQTSIYHEEKSLPMTDLRRWEENCNRDIRWGPHPRIEAITSNNRMKIMTALLFCYNRQVSQTQKSSLIYLCRVASQLVNEGFSNKSQNRLSYGTDQTVASKSVTPRIPLNSAFLVELSHAIYFAMFNGFGTVAIQMFEEIHNRACFELYTELILLTSAVRNSLRANPSGQPSDGPMGLSVALTPSTNTVTTAITKSMITNASFRTKKLPDDIPIQIQDLHKPQTMHQLVSVNEEMPEATRDQKDTMQQGQRNLIIRPSVEGIKAHAHKALIAGFKKAKDKDIGKINLPSSPNTINSSSTDPPKPPQRKSDKHLQRHSLLQLQIDNGSSTLDYENSALSYRGRTCDPIETTEILPMQTLIVKESGSSTLSSDSDANCGTDVNNSVLVNSNNSTTTTISVISSDLLTTKSFESNIDIYNTNGVGVKASDSLMN